MEEVQFECVGLIYYLWFPPRNSCYSSEAIFLFLHTRFENLSRWTEWYSAVSNTVSRHPSGWQSESCFSTQFKGISKLISLWKSPKFVIDLKFRNSPRTKPFSEPTRTMISAVVIHYTISPTVLPTLTICIRCVHPCIIQTCNNFFNLHSGGWNQGPLDTAAT
jgi:hypothetical protein